MVLMLSWNDYSTLLTEKREPKKLPIHATHEKSEGLFVKQILNFHVTNGGWIGWRMLVYRKSVRVLFSLYKRQKNGWLTDVSLLQKVWWFFFFQSKWEIFVFREFTVFYHKKYGSIFFFLFIKVTVFCILASSC